MTRSLTVLIFLICLSTSTLAVDLDRLNESDYRTETQKLVAAAIPQAEADPTRPVYHFRPVSQWMNDICGAIYHEDYCHIFYQYNPTSGDRWGNDHTVWAHARSRDLVNWEDLPWALVPQKQQSELRCNSGCVALDGDGKPMLFYTRVPADGKSTCLGKREQWAARPLDDDLIRWKRLPGPILAAGKKGIPKEVFAGWSDPFVFRAGGQTWVTFKECQGLVGKATDSSLSNWHFAGYIDNVDGECPNFFQLDGHWVLIRSTKPLSYLVGQFDPEKISFKTVRSATTLDYGFGKTPPKDRVWTRGLYGTNIFFDPSGRCLLVGWICGFKGGRGWNGCMSLPRELTLDSQLRLIQKPARELQSLRRDHKKIDSLKASSMTIPIPGLTGDTFELVATLDPGDSRRCGLLLEGDQLGEQSQSITLEEGVLDVAGTKVPVEKGKPVQLRLFLDKSVLELFINNGRASVTKVCYFDGDRDNISFFADQGTATLQSPEFWRLAPARLSVCDPEAFTP